MPEGPAQAAVEVKAAEAPIDDATPDSVNKMLMTLHLWDRPEAVFSKKATTAAKTAATIADFVTRMSKLQDDFGKAVVKTAQDFTAMPFPEGSSLSDGWAAMLKQTLFIGNQFINTSRAFQTQLRVQGGAKKIQPVAPDLTKRMTANIANAKKTQDKENELVKKCKLALDKFKELNKIPADNTSWLETVPAALKTKATELQTANRQAEIAKAMADTVLQQAIQNSLVEFQGLDGARVQAVNSFLLQILDAQNKSLSAAYKTGLATHRTLRSFQEAKDVKEFCDANKTPNGNPCPWLETVAVVGDDGKTTYMMQENGRANAFSRKELAGKTEQAGQVVWKSTTKSTKPHPAVKRTRRHGGSVELPAGVNDHEISLSFTANFLPQMDVMSKSDPFVVVYIQDPVYETFNLIGRTETIMDDEDPIWTTKISFDPKSVNDTLKFLVYDDDNADKSAYLDLTKHDYIGEVTIHVADFQSANPLTLPLKDKKGAAVIKGKGCNSASVITISSAVRGAKEPEAKTAATAATTTTSTTTTTTTESAATAPTRTAAISTTTAEPVKSPPPPPPTEQKTEDQPEGVDDATRGEYSPDNNVPDDGYDGGLMTPIVIDNGSAYFKAGFSGDRLPSYVVPGVVARFPPPWSTGEDDRKATLLGAAAQHIGPGLCPNFDDLELNDTVFSDQPNWDDVELMWDYLFQRLGIDVQSHPVLLTQPTLAPLALKATIEEIMYEKFNCPAIYVARAPLLSPYAYGHSSGLVVDVGHSSAQVIPIIDGYVLDAHARRVRHLGGLKDSQRIVQYFKENTNTEDPMEASRYASHSHISLMAQSIKDRMCVCPASRDEYTEELAVLHDVEGFLGGQDPDEAVNAKQKRPNMLTLQKELITCAEVLFQPKELLKDHDASIVSLQDLCRDVAMACDVDTRRTLLSNIFLSGQVTTMPGFAERLTQEIRLSVPHAPYIRVYGEERRYASWTGGSVLTALDAFQDSWKFRMDWDDERRT